MNDAYSNRKIDCDKEKGKERCAISNAILTQRVGLQDKSVSIQ